MCNPNNFCNKIATAKLEQFNLTIRDWCVRIYLLLVVTCIHQVWFTPADWCNQPVTVLPKSATQLTSTPTVYTVLENYHRVAELSAKWDAEPALVYCWAIIANDKPTLYQHLVNVSCLLALSSGNNCTIILLIFSLYTCIRASMITLFNYHFCVT